MKNSGKKRVPFSGFVEPGGIQVLADHRQTASRFIKEFLKQEDPRRQ
jgi:hypothetical protein